WYFGGPILIVRQRLCTKNLRVPSLDFGYRGFCHRELDITVLDRNLLVLVFHNFDAQAIRYGHERLIGSAIDARLHLHARSFQPSSPISVPMGRASSRRQRTILRVSGMPRAENRSQTCGTKPTFSLPSSVPMACESSPYLTTRPCGSGIP